MNQETLLPIHRQFTYKEKIALLKQRLKVAEMKLDKQTLIVNKLEKQVFNLKEKLKQDDIEFPNKISGSTKVSAKAYSKLLKQSRMWQDRFWETWEELEKLKVTQ